MGGIPQRARDGGAVMSMDERDREFTAFLKAQWQAVDLVKVNVRDEVPKPDVMPVGQA